MTPFTTILCDPPWTFTQPLAMADGVKRSSASQYPTMTLGEIETIYQPPTRGVSAIRQPPTLAGYPIAEVAFLWLWVPASLLLEGVHDHVCRAWGFAPKQIVPWVKGRLAVDVPGGDPWRSTAKLVIQPGMGALTRVCVEYLVVATRGKYSSLVAAHNVNGLVVAEEEAWILAPKSRHSRKPVECYQMIERLCPGPWLELFARERRAGWTSHGDQLPSVNMAVLPDPGLDWPPV